MGHHHLRVIAERWLPRHEKAQSITGRSTMSATSTWRRDRRAASRRRRAAGTLSGVRICACAICRRPSAQKKPGPAGARS